MLHLSTANIVKPIIYSEIQQPLYDYYCTTYIVRCPSLL